MGHFAQLPYLLILSSSAISQQYSAAEQIGACYEAYLICILCDEAIFILSGPFGAAACNRYNFHGSYQRQQVCCHCLWHSGPA